MDKEKIKVTPEEEQSVKDSSPEKLPLNPTAQGFTGQEVRKRLGKSGNLLIELLKEKMNEVYENLVFIDSDKTKIGYHEIINSGTPSTINSIISKILRQRTLELGSFSTIEVQITNESLINYAYKADDWNDIYPVSSNTRLIINYVTTAYRSLSQNIYLVYGVLNITDQSSVRYNVWKQNVSFNYNTETETITYNPTPSKFKNVFTDLTDVLNDINNLKDKTSFLIKNGDGTLFLANDGTYKVINVSDKVDLTSDQEVAGVKNFVTRLEYMGEEVATKQDLSTVFIYKGSVETFDDLPTTNNKIGDTWNVLDSGNNYAWDGTKWDDLSGVFDLSEYVKKDEIKDIGAHSLIGTGSLREIYFNSSESAYSKFDFNHLEIEYLNQGEHPQQVYLSPGQLMLQYGDGNYLYLEATDGLKMVNRVLNKNVNIFNNGITEGLIIDGGDL